MAMTLGLACAASAKAQVPLQWDLVTDSLLADVDLSEEPPIDLGNLQFVDNETGIITTHLGGIIRTEDGGVTWSLVSNDTNDFEYYFFLNKNVWFSSPSRDGNIWGRTLDAGKHWEFFKNTKCPAITPFFVSADIGWGFSGFSICTTKDGGRTWSVLIQNSKVIQSLGTPFMLEDRKGWIISEREVLGASGGSNWLAEFQDTSVRATEIRFMDRNSGYMKLYGSKAGTISWEAILYSKDGGQHWEHSSWKWPEVNDLRKRLSNCAMQGRQDLWVIGYLDKTHGPSAPSNFVLFHSRDGGMSFESASKLPDNAARPKSIAIASQQDKPVLLMLDANGALWQTFLPVN
jgi:photosystem II stability/assembly factor-like uncharacterized protein